jgi:hypothetical protein
MMANYFHFTPKQVDEMEVCLIESLLYQLKLMKEKEAKSIKDGNS